MACTCFTKHPLPLLNFTRPTKNFPSPALPPSQILTFPTFWPQIPHSVHPIFLISLLPSFTPSSQVSKGDVPPNFTLKDQDGKTVSLSKFKGKPVVVYFYPADETPGCTKEACAFRDSYEKFKKAGAEVVGISGDDPPLTRLPFTLLSDEGNKVRKGGGSSDLFGTLPGRQTYVLDRNGVVQLVYNNQFQPEKHVEETLKLLQSI
uniref:thioredoxin-dependent peroxiredoxin n=1 Tax=Ananas comosus var. bracteatus TaxID=296719 RepID=A0A6V7PP45_ANACO|nr:unnamed protein product [Ananas comosus var. bracteatus]